MVKRRISSSSKESNLSIHSKQKTNFSDKNNSLNNNSTSSVFLLKKEMKIFKPFYDFYHKLLHPKFCYIRDLYPIMFFLDIFCFFIVAFGFSWFGEGGSGNVFNDLQVFNCLFFL